MKYKKLSQIFNKASVKNLTEFVELWNKHASSFGLDKEVQENLFLAQVLEEVGSDLISKRENLNYTPEGLRNTFKWYRNNPNTSELHGRGNGHSAKQESIGNHAYANRLGNGPVKSGDGYRFRGGGYFQLTGRDNYESIAEVSSLAFNVVITAEYIEENMQETRIGLMTAMAFWFSKDIHKEIDINSVTRIVNRYTDSYEQRKKNYERISLL